MSTIFWTGKQWRVTDAGVEECPAANDQDYSIEVGLLAAGFDDAEAGWPAHMAGKPWVDFEDFVKAYLVACIAHGVHLGNIGEILEAGYARRKAAGLPLGPRH